MYEILFYDIKGGRCPIKEFLDSLESKILAKTLRTIDLAKKYKSDYEQRYCNEQL